MKKEEYFLRLERALQFIELNLNENISLQTVSKKAFSSLSHFHRIFFAMTGYSLKDYIRKRRLSNAALELVTSQKKVIDLALDAQFETPETFTRAFKKMFGMSPKEFRIQKKEFEIFRPLEIRLDHFFVENLPQNMEFSFVFLEKQMVMAVKTRTTLENNKQVKDIPGFFKECLKKKLLNNIPSIDDKKIFGIYADMNDDEDFDYAIGLLVQNTKKPLQNYVAYTLPRAEYARFTVIGNSVPELVAAWKYIYAYWMPFSGRARQKGLDFEVYHQEKIEIYIPMKPSPS
jgi:AraC family transcriptional regulator